jgi:hypothetical protein
MGLRACCCLDQALGLSTVEAARWLAPAARGDLAIGITCGFAFMQSVHYAVWLIYVPEDDSDRRAPSSFRRSVRLLSRDLGRFGLALAAGAALLVLAFACVDALRTRALYLSLASFHVYLELAMLAYLLARGRAAARGSARRDARVAAHPNRDVAAFLEQRAGLGAGDDLARGTL